MDELLTIASPAESGSRHVPVAGISGKRAAEAKPDKQPRDEQDQSPAAVGSRWADAIGLAEGGLLLDVAVILDLASIYLPLIGPVLGPAVPTPFAVLMLRRGPRVTLLATAVSAFLVTVITGPHFGWRMGLQALVGLLLGGAMRRGIRPTTIWTGATLLLATVGFCATFGLILLIGYPVEYVVLVLHNSMTSADAMITTVSGWVGAAVFWQQVRPPIADVAHFALQYWVPLYYVYVFIFALPTAALYYAVANASARVLGHDVKPFPPHWVGALWRIVTAPFLPLVWISRLFDRMRRGRDEVAEEDLRPPVKGTPE